ncbi:hypothetical protein [Lachnoclostridium phytofermentans]|uniref:Uncharacterized protein n=1 Tax=Lachnoclostridium phytofermentans (strain ATCC 700394 / DSM 18823 / ISDg) TaxID=357809 RepID=A9KK26_LACP7|nr:hypothetical protein [Lachnoclostridium phytofermentans]ABX42598.1 hypothetical protein Cphy_2233 [Lachnoclostridium phytofermentans ISDg]
MFKVLKWDSIKRWYHIRLFLCLSIIADIVLVILPRSARNLVPFFSIIILFQFIFVAVSCVFNFVIDDLSPLKRLTLIRNVTFLEIFLGKVISNTFWLFTSFTIMWITQELEIKFNTRNMSYLSIKLSMSTFKFGVLFILVYPIVLYALFLLLISIPYFKEFETYVLAVLLIGGFIVNAKMSKANPFSDLVYVICTAISLLVCFLYHYKFKYYLLAE